MALSVYNYIFFIDCDSHSSDDLNVLYFPSITYGLWIYKYWREPHLHYFSFIYHLFKWYFEWLRFSIHYSIHYASDFKNLRLSGSMHADVLPCLFAAMDTCSSPPFYIAYMSLSQYPNVHIILHFQNLLLLPLGLFKTASQDIFIVKDCSR